MNTTLNQTTSTIIPPPNNEIADGDVAWMLASSALVMLMTPGLAFFYGGLVRYKNVINTMMMSFLTLGIITIHWVLFGYSFTFSGPHYFFGSFQYVGLTNVGYEPNPNYGATIPQILYCVYQMMFAVITPAIISGAVVERMKFTSYLLFVLLWSTLVYDSVAHWIWSAWSYTLEDGTVVSNYGWLRALGSIDFAGGTAVHISSAVSALVAAVVVGPRRDIESTSGPSHVPYVLLGGALLWFGWFGFNGGSAVASDRLAALAFINTQIAAAAGMTVWLLLDIFFKKESCAIGATSGAVVGLVAITPAAGFVHAQSSIAIGFIGTMVVYGSVRIKSKILPRFLPQLDDTLDVFTCHGVGGIMGCILTGFFASTKANPRGMDGVFFGNPILLGYQLTAVAATVVWSGLVTLIILLPIKYTLGLSADDEAFLVGLDKHYHGNTIFHHIPTQPPPPESPMQHPNRVVESNETESGLLMAVPPSPVNKLNVEVDVDVEVDDDKTNHSEEDSGEKQEGDDIVVKMKKMDFNVSVDK